MWSWIITAILDNVIPIILTVLLGVVGAKLAHVKSAMTTIADALADGKIDKSEWKNIRDEIKKLIGR